MADATMGNGRRAAARRDAPDRSAAARALCGANGIGADYVDTLFR